MSGVFGLLSLFTGHPINFLQWLFYLASFIVIPVYCHGMLSLKKPRARHMSLISVVYMLDTIVGLFYTIYFAWLWFAEEDSDAASASTAYTGEKLARAVEEDVVALGPVNTNYVWDKVASNEAIRKAANDYIISPLVGRALSERGADLASQSASKGYELFVTVASSVGANVLRIYFTLVVLSFTKQLMRAAKFNNEREDTRLTSFSKLDKFLTTLELKSIRILNRIFSY
ncbi:unnamed protein product [Kuraishia capsulata CBS 1993]|uniref:Uncharacterized protein n=1 Tax=Kuraishia capsulata CBS 1993 TaxID=1382522 RepID=W6MI17_9ASCO|nr:uncharacterized protein KUCA_T00001463001 [Kuraishia capsulata CBS 1993]CDK25493.1 unnamed protein product [Kuraishia capsulata CBS 1993]